jgi:glutamate transport system substrate-binding protein
MFLSQRSHRGRRAQVALLALAAAAGLLAACSSSKSSPKIGSPSGSDYDKVVASAPVASSSIVDGNSWASKIKKQGYLRVGGTDAGPLFSIKDIKTGEVTGFDAGLSQMLSRYITGKASPS